MLPQKLENLFQFVAPLFNYYLGVLTVVSRHCAPPYDSSVVVMTDAFKVALAPPTC